MAFTYMDWIERYNLNFQLYINESNDISVYRKLDFQEVSENLKSFNHTIVDVVSAKKVNGLMYFKIKYKSSVIGWCHPSETTIMYIRNKKQEVKLFDGDWIDNELNSLLKIDTDKLKDDWFKIFTSDFYAIHKDKLYSAIMLKEDLLGFVEITNVSFFINFRQEFKFSSEHVNLYKDSKLEKPSVEGFHHNGESYMALGKFEGLNGARMVLNKKRYWINVEETSLDIELKTVKTIDDVVMDSLIYQLHDKLSKQDDFYVKRIKRLQEKIKVLEEKEEKTKGTLEQLKELL